MKSSILVVLCVSVVLSKHFAEGAPQEISEIDGALPEVPITWEHQCEDPMPIELKTLSKAQKKLFPKTVDKIVTSKSENLVEPMAYAITANSGRCLLQGEPCEGDESDLCCGVCSPSGVCVALNA